MDAQDRPAVLIPFSPAEAVAARPANENPGPVTLSATRLPGTGLNRFGRPPRLVLGDLPRQEDEIRRHVYKRGNVPVRIKIRQENGWRDWYAVESREGRHGWQNCRPEGYAPAAYIGSIDPFHPQVASEEVFWPEGEKDVDTIVWLGLPALTFGGPSEVREEYAEVFRGRRVVVIGDNDPEGQECVRRKVAALAPLAESVRVVDLDGLVDDKGDVSDWVASGKTAEDFHKLVDASPVVAGKRRPISATPFDWIAPQDIPVRRWIYGGHYIRKFISTTVAPGGVGKTALSVVEAMAIVTDRALLGKRPSERTNVWLWNGEDPIDELQRRVMAAAIHYRLHPDDLKGLFIDSGRTTEIVIASQTREGTVIAEPVVDELIKTIRKNQIGLLVIDPFVSSHRVTENDNNAIDAVAKTWARIADATNCAIELVHHVRKTGGFEITVEDGRGAVALLGAVRSARVLNPMGKEEAEKFGVENHRLCFRASNGKANLVPPPESADWYSLVSIDLGNATPDYPGDHVGVVTTWTAQNPLDSIDTCHLSEICRELSLKPGRKDPQASDWVGHMIGRVTGIDSRSKQGAAQIKSLLRFWEASGALRIEKIKDENRTLRPCYVPRDWSDG